MFKTVFDFHLFSFFSTSQISSSIRYYLCFLLFFFSIFVSILVCFFFFFSISATDYFLLRRISDNRGDLTKRLDCKQVSKSSSLLPQERACIFTGSLQLPTLVKVTSKYLMLNETFFSEIKKNIS